MHKNYITPTEELPTRHIALCDCGLDCSYKSPVYKIMLYCLAAFERDTRTWWNPCVKTLEPWNETRRRRFRAMMAALGFAECFKTGRSDRLNPEELYIGRLLINDLNLTGIATFAAIFGGNKPDLCETAMLYQIADVA